jgi:hypothetical protein
MNNVLFRLVALISGVLFGLGMVISGMADPQKVTGFLDIVGLWDPSLMFVMGGALLVFMPAYFLLIKPKSKPVNAEEFCLSTNTTIDKRLVTGAAIFGLGWGIAGVCPGPVVSSLALGNMDVIVFFIAMIAGLGITHKMSQ